MTIQLTAAGLRKALPRAPQIYIDELVKGQHHLAKAGILKTRQRLAYCLANVEHECGGFTIRNLTENINYTAERAAQIWPSRFPGGAAEVQRRFGTGLGWQKLMFDSVYGNRMGNRPGTNDGSRYIGRGACQHTGRDGYLEMQKRTGIPLVEKPELASKPENQAALIAAFWSWKNLNAPADRSDFNGLVKLWNGGHIGLSERRQFMAGNDAAIRGFPDVAAALEVVNELPKKSVVPADKVAAGSAVALGAAGATVAASNGVGTSTIIVIAFVTIAIAATAWFLLRKK